MTVYNLRSTHALLSCLDMNSFHLYSLHKLARTEIQFTSSVQTQKMRLQLWNNMVNLYGWTNMTVLINGYNIHGRQLLSKALG